MLELESIAIEFRYSGRGYYNTVRVGELDDVEGQQEGLAEWCCESVVGG